MRDGNQKVPELKWIGRDWVPLAGSLGNDAQALPSASRPIHVSATALLALQYLPLTLSLFQGRLVCYQSTFDPLVQLLVSALVEENVPAMRAGRGEIPGKGMGSAAFVHVLLRLFGRLLEAKQEYSLPANTDLQLWLFSNSGTGADCRIVSMPDAVLRFLWDAAVEGHHSEIYRMLKVESSDPRFQFLEAIRTGQNYRGLYSFKKWERASQRFYEYYQIRVRGRTGRALNLARTLAGEVVRGANPKRLNDLRKSEVFRSSENRNIVRKAVADSFTMSDYDSLFPTVRTHPIAIDQSSWNVIRFYIAQRAIEPTVLQEAEVRRTTHPKIELIATEYFRLRGPERIKKVLDRLNRGIIGIPWLEARFLEMAQIHPEFELGDWDEFVCDEDGRPAPRELLFQMRLKLANLYRESKPKEASN